ncbi:hypothetical protein Bca101_032157 [Brassica carinata]
MRENDYNWFAGWEKELPSPNRLMPLSQFQPMPSQLQLPSSQANSSAEFAENSADRGSGDEPARTLRRPRNIWTPQLHQRFLDAFEHHGINHATPKRITEFMNVDGLTRGSVASHLQKYRYQLKRIERREPFASFLVGKIKPSPSPSPSPLQSRL